MKPLSTRDRILGGLWGASVGDALGVPVEFKNRFVLSSDPITGMRGHGSHHQPAGTWSDDTSLTLCAIESLLYGFNTDDMGQRFVDWLQQNRWTPWGDVFDIGLTTMDALSRVAKGTKAEEAGSRDEHSNGNGSLMRILPLALLFASEPVDLLLDHVHRASAITHGHPRSQMACGFYCMLVAKLLKGFTPLDAYLQTVEEFNSHYQKEPLFAAQLPRFSRLISGNIHVKNSDDIVSSGYVLHTLEASIWSLLTSNSFAETVLKAVNLGGDTDTTGCVAGGLAGVFYGSRAIREDWIKILARKGDLDCLYHEFADLCETKKGS
ncbi:ADP-ribosylglycohydrolase family protein [Pedosphaera parvula]|uniref:ADP-ribosylation/Crystallin J1 n=1 Tax=Pedosphaera parvula (strain Ellin514) TaxID=320771 RepID=B9XNA6_PEDPL|nr:ADP-ribosylglycohydrolase family protein [Pedosphaera parvula]EEF58659.1 ADP-ribosylation/Crystallin J1 [Pedosphaera parvula Ellin514]